MAGKAFSSANVRIQTIVRRNGSSQQYMTLPGRLVEALGGARELQLTLNSDGSILAVPAGTGGGVTEEAYLGAFWSAWGVLRPAFNTEDGWRNAGLAAVGDLLNTGRHTLTGALESIGLTASDWNKFYRIYSKGRVDIGLCEKLLVDALLAELPDDATVLLVIDDTQLRKSGRKIPFAKWLHDKLGPKFNVNLIWGIRFIQISLAVASPDGGCRCYPVAFFLCPPCNAGKKTRRGKGGGKNGGGGRKGGKNGGGGKAENQGGKAKTAASACSSGAKEEKTVQSPAGLPAVAGERISKLVAYIREKHGRKVLVDGDGGYTNKVFCGCVASSGAEYLGRARKDASLFARPPQEGARRGRIRYYGEALPTPWEIYRSVDVPFKDVAIELGGEGHEYRVKELVVRSKIFGNKDIRLIVVAPVYFVKGKAQGHREPLFLVTTDTESSVADLLKYYIWRWEIELNFKDEKSVLGISDPQNWKPEALERRTPLLALTYSIFMLASRRHFGEGNPLTIQPAWRKNKKSRRCPAAGYIGIFRKAAARIACVMGNKSEFDGSTPPIKNLFLFLEAVFEKTAV